MRTKAERTRPAPRAARGRPYAAILLQLLVSSSVSCFFFFNDTATTEIYTLSLHDALPIHAHMAWKIRPSFLDYHQYDDARTLWQHQEGTVAQERAGGCRHVDPSGSSPGWYGGRDFGSRNDGERRRGTAKTDARCPGQIRSQENDGCTHFSRVG